MSNFKEIYGQEAAKRAIEIAVAGRHSILISGPMGCGKTTLAKAASDLAESEPLDDADLNPGNFMNLATVMDGDESFIIATATDRTLLPLRVLDRFAIILLLNHLSAADLLLPPPAEDSAAVKARIAKARIAKARRRPESFQRPALELLRTCVEQVPLTVRGFKHAKAVAATIASLDGEDTVGRVHIAEAVSYIWPKK